MASIRDELRRSIPLLKSAGVESPQLDAELLLAASCNVSRLEIIANPDKVLNKSEFIRFRRLLAARIRRLPLAYLLKKQEFWGLELEVSPAVLVPRPETETVVEASLDFLNKISKPVVLDVGTGSGAIAIALAKELPHAKIMAIDISEKALRIARRNAKKYGVNIRFLKCDLRDSETLKRVPRLDAIVSNPPYIPSGEIDGLQPEIAKHEPRIALDGGKDGLDFHRTIADLAVKKLKKTGRVFVEVASGQAEKASALYNNSQMNLISFRRDLAGIERVLVAEKRDV